MTARWMTFRLIDRPYYRKDGTIIDRPLSTDCYGITDIQGGGKVYPQEALRLKRLDWWEEGTTLMLLVDEPQEKIDQIKAMKGQSTYQITPSQTKMYYLEEHQPQELNDSAALAELKHVFHLPEGTVLGPDKRPVIPSKERSNEKNPNSL